MNHFDRKSCNSLYRRWHAIRNRCGTITSKDFPAYGAKGIRVCEQWAQSFEKFVQWAIDNGYNESLQIDRIDPDGNYEPLNCRWVTLRENVRRARNGNRGKHLKNRPKRKFSECQVLEIFNLSIGGMKKSEIARIYNVDPTTIGILLAGKTYKWVKRPQEIPIPSATII